MQGTGGPTEQSKGDGTTKSIFKSASISVKILLTTFKALHGINPLYLCELISPYQPRRALRSSDQLLLEQPAYKLKSYGSRAFSVCAPGLWNKLPLEIKSSTSVPEFKRRLKTHLFRQAFSFNS